MKLGFSNNLKVGSVAPRAPGPGPERRGAHGVTLPTAIAGSWSRYAVLKEWSLPMTPNARRQIAFTLPEMMIALSILTLVLAGIISSHLFGIRMLEITKAKLGASDEARSAISKLISEIRSAKRIQIGTGDLTGFSEVADGLPQQGSAVQIYGTTNTNFYARYYWDAGDKKLKRTANGNPAVAIIAQSITNTLVFTAEDFAGNLITNNQNNSVIGLLLQFYQIQYPVIPIGPGNYYDFYQLRTRVTRRTLE